MGRLSLALPLSPITISSLMSVIKIAIMSLSNKVVEKTDLRLCFLFYQTFSALAGEVTIFQRQTRWIHYIEPSL